MSRFIPQTLKVKLILLRLFKLEFNFLIPNNGYKRP